MEFGLVGLSVEKSFSKKIHESISKIDYSLLSIKTEDNFTKFLLSHDFKGINVTIPYKIAAFKACDIISEEAKSIGVVNTVINKNGTLYGYNTDAFGFEYLLEHNDVVIKDKRCIVMGTGATSKTVSYVLNKLGAKSVSFLSRTPKGDNHSYNDIILLKTAEIIINTTPNRDDVLIDSNYCDNLTTFVDVIYNPILTKQALAFKKKGVRLINGLRMLIAQAVKADELFVEQAINESTIESEYLKVFSKERNIVLIGHPLSGKTTLAKSLAKDLQMELIDTDVLVEQKYGMSINQIFDEFGEENFRKVESEIIDQLSNVKGAVISSGGGMILNPSNIEKIRDNSLIINLTRKYLNVSDNELLKRPLLKTLEKLKETIIDRQEKYKSFADFTIENDTIASTIEKIRRVL